MKHLTHVAAMLAIAAGVVACSSTLHERNPEHLAKNSPAGRTVLGWADKETLIFKLCKDPIYSPEGVLIDDGLVLSEVIVNRASVMDELLGLTQIAYNATGALFFIGGFGYFTEMWGPSYDVTQSQNVFLKVEPGPGPVPFPDPR